jgi:F0F1-type ATP synthase assembly protein I
MPIGEQQPDQVKQAQASLRLAFSVMGQIGLLTVGLVIVALVGGLWLDKQFSTRPLFTVLLMVASFPASLYIIYRVALGAVAKIQTTATKPPRAKEELTSDDNSTA